MNRVAHYTSYAGLALALLFALVFIAPTAFAADQNGQSANVIGRIPISGPPVRQMLLSTQGAKHFLYVDQGGSNGVTLVDVTHPGNPQIVQQHVKWPDSTANQQMEVVGSNMAVTQQREGASNREPRPKEVNILDLTNPSHPVVLDTFRDVSTVVPDNSRNLIFVAEPTEVLLVQHHVSQVGWAVQHECNSESAISAMPPDCY
jgi:hypothetical protein